LLENPRRIEAGGGPENPNEFWFYETWEDEQAVERHESGEAFQSYKERLRPLVDPDTILFGNTEPIKVLGYRVRGARD